MPNRISSTKPDEVQNATISAAMISRVMAEMGRRGGRIGGKRRLVTLTGKRRRDIASAAAKARWIKRGTETKTQGGKT